MAENYLKSVYDYVGSKMNGLPDYDTFSERLRTDENFRKKMHAYLTSKGVRVGYDDFAKNLEPWYVNVLDTDSRTRGTEEDKFGSSSGIRMSDQSQPKPVQEESASAVPEAAAQISNNAAAMAEEAKAQNESGNLMGNAQQSSPVAAQATAQHPAPVQKAPTQQPQTAMAGSMPQNRANGTMGNMRPSVKPAQDRNEAPANAMIFKDQQNGYYMDKQTSIYDDAMQTVNRLQQEADEREKARRKNNPTFNEWIENLEDESDDKSPALLTGDNENRNTAIDIADFSTSYSKKYHPQGWSYKEEAEWKSAIQDADAIDGSTEDGAAKKKKAYDEVYASINKSLGEGGAELFRKYMKDESIETLQNDLNRKTYMMEERLNESSHEIARALRVLQEEEKKQINSEDFKKANKAYHAAVSKRRALAVANKIAGKIQDTIDLYNYDSKYDSALGNVFMSFGKRVSHLDNWDFGLSDLFLNEWMLGVIEKDDRGVALYPEEEEMLDMAAMKLAVDAAAELGVSIDAGMVTAEAIPFMIQMLIDPAAALGKGVGSRVARYAMKKAVTRAASKKTLSKTLQKMLESKAGRMAIRGAANTLGMGAQFGADTASGAAMALNTGEIKLVAGAKERQIGELKGKVDEAGNYVYDGHMGEDAFTSYLKSFADWTVENQSERLGDSFIDPAMESLAGLFGKGAKKLVGKLAKTDAKILTRMYQDSKHLLSVVNRKNWPKVMKSIAERSHFSGVIGETGEEIIGNFEKNLIGVQDEPITWDSTKDTFITMIPMQVMFGLLGIGGASIEKFHTGRALSSADDDCSRLLGERWGRIKRSLFLKADDEFAKSIGEMMGDGSLTVQQRRAIGRYAIARQVHRGVEDAKNQWKDHNTFDKVTMEAYETGTMLQNDEDKQNASVILNTKMYDAMTDAEVGSYFDSLNINGEETLEQMKRNGASESGLKKAYDYVHARRLMDGVVDAVHEGNKALMEEIRRLLEERANEDGMIYTVELVTGETGYVKKGYPKSPGEELTIVDEEGNVIHTMSDGVTLRLTQNLEDSLNVHEESKRNEEEQFVKNVLKLEMPEISLGSKLEITNENGEREEVVVISETTDGRYVLADNHGEHFTDESGNDMLFTKDMLYDEWYGGLLMRSQATMNARYGDDMVSGVVPSVVAEDTADAGTDEAAPVDDETAPTVAPSATPTAEGGIENDSENFKILMEKGEIKLVDGRILRCGEMTPEGKYVVTFYAPDGITPMGSEEYDKRQLEAILNPVQNEADNSEEGDTSSGEAPASETPAEEPAVPEEPGENEEEKAGREAEEKAAAERAAAEEEERKRQEKLADISSEAYLNALDEYADKTLDELVKLKNRFNNALDIAGSDEKKAEYKGRLKAIDELIDERKAEPVVEEPVSEDPAVDEPTAEKPATDEPVSEKPENGETSSEENPEKKDEEYNKDEGESLDNTDGSSEEESVASESSEPASESSADGESGAESSAETTAESSESKPESGGRSRTGRRGSRRPDASFTKEEANAYFEGKYGKGNKADKALAFWEKIYGSNRNGRRLSNHLGFRNGADISKDKEIFYAGIDFGVELVKDGAYKFEDFLYEMIDALGDGVKPYVKIVYTAIRQNSDDVTYEKMDDETTVRKFDVENYNIDEVDEEENAEEENPTGESASSESETETNNNEEENETTGRDTGVSGGDAVSDGEDTEGRTDEPGADGSVDNDGSNGEREAGSGSDGGRGVADGEGELSEPTDAGGAEGGAEGHDETEGDGRGPSGRTGQSSDGPAGVDERADGGEAVGTTGVGGNDSGMDDKRRRDGSKSIADAKKRGNEKVPYTPKSKGRSLGSVMPTASASATNDALDRLGDVDEMVMNALGYESLEELYSHLAAEQIDGVGLSIEAAKKGYTMVIGDQTGIGKGRQAAAMLRYAMNQGKKPIFFTQKPTLFSDLYRDMKDIGSEKKVPLIINAANGNIVEGVTLVQIPVTDDNGEPVYDENGYPEYSEYIEGGKTIYSHNKKDVKKFLETGEVPEGYDYVVVTYSQIQGSNDRAENRKNALLKLASGNLIVMDESHTAAGQGNTADYIKKVVKEAEGVTFLSATYAKNPSCMPMYAMRSVINDANLSQGDLIKAIESGGVPMQEIMSEAFTQSGAMIRRERDMTGVKVDWKPMSADPSVQREKYDEMIGFFRKISRFEQMYILPVLDEIKSKLPKDQKLVHVINRSRLYNIINQMTTAIKVEETIKEALDALARGEKPYITMADTNAAMMDEYFGVGGEIEKYDISIVLQRLLKRALTYKINTYEKGDVIKSEEIELSEYNLPGYGSEAYQELLDEITEYASGLPVSPIDEIRMALEKEGYVVGEITGRDNMVADEDGTYRYVRRDKPDRNETVDRFNKDEIDVLIMNKSGSTGLSIHNKEWYEGQEKDGKCKPRHHITVQPQADVNDEAQMRGRGDRTGQLTRCIYTYIMTHIPAESRIMMMLKKKLSSLDAQSTASGKSEFNEVETVDFGNKYGSECMVEILKTMPELLLEMDDPLGITKKLDRIPDVDEIKVLLESYVAKPGDWNKIMKRVGMLTTEEQDDFLSSVANSYVRRIDQLNATNMNDLEIKDIDLEAETLQVAEYVKGEAPGGDNVFADSAYIEEVMANPTSRPMSKQEVKAAIADALDGKSEEDARGEYLKKLEAYVAKEKEKLKKNHDASIEKRSNTVRKNIEKRREDDRIKHEENEKKGKIWTDEEFEDAVKKGIEEVARQADEAMRKAEDLLDMRASAIRNVLEGIRIGHYYDVFREVGFGKNVSHENADGVVIGLKVSDNMNPKTCAVIMALPNGKRLVSIPFSDKSAVGDMIRQESKSKKDGTSMGTDVTDDWDYMLSDKSGERKKRLIITGNLLTAISNAKSMGNNGNLGQIISYTTKDGMVRRGILMPEGTKISAFGHAVSFGTIADRIKQYCTYIGFEEFVSADKKVTIKCNPRNVYRDFRVVIRKTDSSGILDDKEMLQSMFGESYAGKTIKDICSMVSGSYCLDFDDGNGSKVDKLIEFLDKYNIMYNEALTFDESGKNNHIAGLKRESNYPIETFEGLFNKWNTDTKNKALADKVFEIAKKIGLTVKIGDTEDKDVGGYYSVKSNEIKLKYNFFAFQEKDDYRAEVMLHEFIHSITAYAIYAADSKYKLGLENRLNDGLREAVTELNDLYAYLMRNHPEIKHMYGMTNAHEMIAELANPEWRSTLGRYKILGKVMNAVSKVIRNIYAAVTGKNPDTTIEDRLEAILQKFYDNFDKKLYDDVVIASNKKREKNGDVIDENRSKSDRDKRIKNAEAIKVQKWVGGYHPEDFGITEESVREAYEIGQKSKILDVITRDDRGYIIPLSERFNPSKRGDVRYRNIARSGSDRIPTDDVRRVAEMQANELGSKVRVVDEGELDGLPRSVQDAFNGGHAAAYYDVETGEVVVYAPNAHDTDDIRKTVLHEVLGHKGLRQLIGESRYDEVMLNMLKLMPPYMREQVARKQKELWLDAIRNGETGTSRNYRAEAVDEVLADMAEEYDPKKLTFWKKVTGAVREMLRRLGFGDEMEFTDDEITYMLWRSHQTMKNGGHWSFMDALSDNRQQSKYGTGMFSARRRNDWDPDDDPDGGGNGNGGGRKTRRRPITNGTMRVWQGSGSDFDKHDSAYFLSGEGSMAYGYGHYVSDVKETGKMYAEIASSNKLAKVAEEKGKEYNAALSEFNSRYMGDDGSIDFLEDGAMEAWNNLEEKKKAFEEANMKFVGNMKGEEGKRFLYEIDVPDDNGDNYLRWNEESTSQQRSRIADVIAKDMNLPEWTKPYLFYEGVADALTENDFANEDELRDYLLQNDIMIGNPTTGEGITIGMKQYYYPKEASEALTRAGIVGMKVPTGYKSGGDGRGTNYVIFSDDDMKIVRKTRFRRTAKKPTSAPSAMSSTAGVIYDRANAGFLAAADEAWHDMYRSLFHLQRAVSTESGKEVKDFEDAYDMITMLPRVNKAETDILIRDHIDPIVDFVNSLLKKYDVTEEELSAYFIAKHGIERNDKFAWRDAVREADKKYDLEVAAAMLAAGNMTQAEYDQMVQDRDDLINALYAKNRTKDYSGLTETFREGADPDSGASVAELEARAAQYAKDFEDKITDGELDELWDKLRALSEFTIGKTYSSGLISKEARDEVLAMFDYYVPLRGWDGTNAEDVYEYERIGVTESEMQQAVKNAEGRKTTAGNILPTMFVMAHSAIMSGNKNKAKRAMFHLAQNHKSKVMSITGQWAENIGGVWVDVEAPDYDPNKTDEENADEMAQWEKDMMDKRSQGLAKRTRNRLGLGVPITNMDAQQHKVRVMVNGMLYTININANPKAAQAINGLLNKMQTNDAQREAIQRLNRFMATVYTTFSPLFSTRNFERDLTSAVNVSAAKYGAKYVAELGKNMAKLAAHVGISMGDAVENANVFLRMVGGVLEGSDVAALSAGMQSLYYKMRHGKLDTSNDVERYFKEFIENGGETGYQSLYSIDEFNEMMKKNFEKKDRSKAGRAMQSMTNAVMAPLENLRRVNESIENMTRFAVYMTSRQMKDASGNERSILKSIVDSADASTNFNKKGSGAMMNKLMRTMVLFANASIQGAMRYVDLMIKDMPEPTRKAWGINKRAGLRVASAQGVWVMIGALNALAGWWLLSMMGDDDDKEYDDTWDNPYWRLSKWKRTHTVQMYLPGVNSGSLQWALAPEEAAFYGTGVAMAEYAIEHMKGGRYYGRPNKGADELMSTIGGNLLSTVPVVGGGDPLSMVVGSSGNVFVSAFMTNRDFMGRDISNRKEWNRGMPEYRRLRKDTPENQVRLAEELYVKYGIDINMNITTYLMRAAAGGLYDMPSMYYKSYKKWVQGDPYNDISDDELLFFAPNWASMNREWQMDRALKLEYDSYEDIAKQYGNELKAAEYITQADLKDDILSNLEQDSRKKVYDIYQEYKANGSYYYKARSERARSYDKYVRAMSDGESQEEIEKKRMQFEEDDKAMLELLKDYNDSRKEAVRRWRMLD